MKKSIILSLIVGILVHMAAIKNVSAQLDSLFWNLDMQDIADLSSREGWVKLKVNSNISTGTLFSSKKTAFGLGSDDNMSIVKTETDELGYTHCRYQQTYKAVKVEGAEYIEHSIGGFVKKANGKIVKGLNLNVSSSISSNNALIFTLNYINAITYMWEDTIEEQLLKQLRGDNNATYYPTPELLITRKLDTMQMKEENFIIAYKIDIYTKLPFGGKSIYIDPNNGNVIKEIPIVINCLPTTGCTLYNGTQNINTEQNSYDSYRLFDDCRGDGIHTTKLNLVDYLDVPDNIWTTNCHAVQTHWGGEMTFDYFNSVFGFNSYDNNGTIMTQTVTSNCLDNAYYGNGHTTFCAGSNYANNWLTSLDIVGHEWGHGLTETTANLTYSGESGALNESFSDIWGVMVEYYAQDLYDPSNPGDWLIGEDFWKPSLDGYLRSMSNPKAKPNQPTWAQPDTYLGLNWYNLSADVHNGPQKIYMVCVLLNGTKL